MEDEKKKFNLNYLKRQEFYEPQLFDFTKILESNWKEIKKEFENLQSFLFHPWPENNLYQQNGEEGKGWNVFGLYAFGKKHYKNSKLCPLTTALVEQIPGMSTAAFSILSPYSKIIPHVGYYGYSEMVLRCHLGLSVPPKELCWLSVGDQKQSWEEGKCLIFDDTFIHSAINESCISRVILLLDFSVELSKKEQDVEFIFHQRDYLESITAQYGYGIQEEK